MAERIGLEAVLDDKDFQAGVGRYTSAVQKMGSETDAAGGKAKSGLQGVSTAALAIGAAAVTGIVALGTALWDCANAAAEEEAGIVRLSTAVTASGVSWSAVGDEVEAYIAAAQRRTAFDDGVQRASLTALITTTGSLEQAMSLLPLAMDLARAKGMELSAASEIVGKVAMGNTGILSRYGIVLQEGATAQEALAMMQERFAGQADAYGKTTKASMELVGQQFDNLKEEIGAVVLPILVMFMQALANLVADLLPAVGAAVAAVQPIVETVWGAIQSAINQAWGIIEPIFNAIVSWFSGPGTSSLTELGAAYEGVWIAIQDLIGTVLPMIQTLIETVFGAVQTFLSDHGDEIMTIIQTAWTLVQNVITTVLGVIEGIIKAFTSALKGDWQGVWDALLGIVKTMMNGIKTHIDTILGAIKSLIGDFSLADAGRNLIESLASGVTAAAGAIRDAVARAVRGAIDAALRALGIGSPSKVGLALGANFGASIGLGAMEGLRGVGGGIGAALSGMTASAIGGGRVTAPAMMGGGTTVNNTYNLSANYRNYQSEGSLRDTVRLLQAGVG